MGENGVVGLDLQLEDGHGDDHVRVLQAVLGESKAVGDGPTAENGGDKLRFKRIRVELASVAPIGAISHGWAEWVPRSIGWADLGLIAAFNGGLEVSTKRW
jgi:hypothetical protein